MPGAESWNSAFLLHLSAARTPALGLKELRAGRVREGCDGAGWGLSWVELEVAGGLGGGGEGGRSCMARRA